MSKPIILQFIGDGKPLESTFDKVGEKAKHFGGGLGKLAGIGKAALGGIATAAFGVGAASLEMADKYEVAHANLETALHNTGTNFEAVKKQVEALTKSGVKFGFTATDIEAALSTMTTGMGSSKKAMQNLQLAEDLSAKTGKPLADASLAITKAYNGQLRPLKQLGIDLPIAAGGAVKVAAAHAKLKTDLAAYMDIEAKYHAGLLKTPAQLDSIAKALRKVHLDQTKLSQVQNAGSNILDALGKKLEGAASRQADTFGGKIKAVKAQVQDWGIKIGLALIPKIILLVTWLQKGTDWLGKHREVATALALVIGGTLVIAIGAYIASMIAAAAATVIAAAPVIALGLAVTALAGSVVYLWNHWDQVWTWIKGHKAYAAIIAIIFPIIPALIGIVKGVQYLWNNWRPIWAAVSNVTKIAGAVISNVVGGIVTVVQWVATMVGNIIGGHWGKAWAQFSDFAKLATAQVWGFLSGLPGKILGIIPAAAGALRDAGSQIIHAMWDGIKSAWNWLADHTTFSLPKFHIPGTSTDIGGGSVSLLPHLAKGGVFSSPTLAMIGEKSSSSNVEIATPEKLLRDIVRQESGAGGRGTLRNHQGGGLTIQHMTVHAADPRAAASQIGHDLAWAAKTSGY